jgi:hypothetical protein
LVSFQPIFRSFFEHLGEKPFYILELLTSSTLPIRSPSGLVIWLNVRTKLLG